jgi:hypothetical protein
LVPARFSAVNELLELDKLLDRDELLELLDREDEEELEDEDMR